MIAKAKKNHKKIQTTIIIFTYEKKIFYVYLRQEKGLVKCQDDIVEIFVAEIIEITFFFKLLILLEIVWFLKMFV